jgi:hypothetical protein
MRLGSRLPPPDTTRDENRLNPPDAESTSPVAKAARSVKQWASDLTTNLQRAGADRTRLSPTGLPAHTTAAIGPTRVDTRPSVDIAASVRLPNKQMSAATLGRVDDKVKTATNSIAQPLHPLTRAPDEHFESRAAFKSLEACTGAILQMFAPEGGPPSAELNALMTSLLSPRHMQPGRHRDQQHPLHYERPLILATALSRVCKSPERALAAYQALLEHPTHLGGLNDARAMASSTPASAEHQALANRVRCVLASTASGMAALAQLEGIEIDRLPQHERPEAEAKLQAYSLALRACHVLERHGVQPPAVSNRSLQAFQGALPAEFLGARLGSGDRADPPEARSTLPAQALTYAIARMQGPVPPALAACKPAYVALRNGFTESGKGSDFNRAIERLHSFMKYADRAVAAQRPLQGETGMAKAADWLGRKAKSAFIDIPKRALGGQLKSPLESVRYGTHGTTLDLLKAEKQKYGRKLDEALQQGIAAIRNDLQTLRDEHSTEPDYQRRASQLIVRALALEDWRNRNRPDGGDEYHGVKGHAVDLDSLLQAAANEARHIGIDLDRDAATRELQARSRGRLQPRPMHLKTLETWARPENGDLSDALKDSIREAREIASAKRTIEQAGLFDLVRHSGLGSGVKQWIQGSPKPSLDDIQDKVNSICKGTDVASFSDGGNVGLGGTVGLSLTGVQVNDVALGAGPTAEVSGETGRHAVFRVGVTSTSGEFFLGTERRSGATGGAGAFAGTKLPGLVQFTGSAGARYGYSHTTGTGVAIRVRKNGEEWKSLPEFRDPNGPKVEDENWKYMTAKVADFMFDEARKGPADRAGSGAELWRRFVDQFGDNQDVSINWVESKASSHKVSLQLNGTGRLGNSSARTGVSVGAGMEHVFGAKSERIDKSGAFSHSQAAKGTRTTAGVQGSAAYNLPGLPVESRVIAGDVATQSVSLPAVALYSIGREATLHASNGSIRLTSEGGRLVPDLCFKQREFGTASEFTSFVESKRAQWERAVGKSDSENVLRYHRDELNKLLRAVASLPERGNKVFVERMSLKQEAAAMIDAYQARLDTLKGEGDLQSRIGDLQGTPIAREVQLLENQILAELTNEENWQPFRLYASETSSTAKDSGLDVFLKLSRRSEATGGRDLVVLNAERRPDGGVQPVDRQPGVLDSAGPGEAGMVFARSRSEEGLPHVDPRTPLTAHPEAGLREATGQTDDDTDVSVEMEDTRPQTPPRSSSLHQRRTGNLGSQGSNNSSRASSIARHQGLTIDTQRDSPPKR